MWRLIVHTSFGAVMCSVLAHALGNGLRGPGVGDTIVGAFRQGKVLEKRVESVQPRFVIVLWCLIVQLPEVIPMF